MMGKGTVLIADDEAILTNTVHKILTSAGMNAIPCIDGGRFLAKVEEQRPEAILLDIYYGGLNGIQLFQELKQRGFSAPVIIMTAHADVGLAVQAMKEGAFDFITKPFDMSHLLLLVERALDHSRLRSHVQLLRQQINDQHLRSGIIGTSPHVLQCLDLARKLAQGNSTTVLLEGESGTGKELFARFIYQNSPRGEKPFVTINCGAIPKELAESEFFGYEKGAFTGATEKMKQGKFEMADGGTLLLDEVGELSLEMQVKLLRVLEEKKFYRLGGTKEIAVDVRVIAATNRDLAKEVEAGRFREDLFYRLNVAAIRIPALRERKEDIAALTSAFVSEFAEKFGKAEHVITPECERLLKELPWNGNVRELRNAVERVMLISNAGPLTPDHFAFVRNKGAQRQASDGTLRPSNGHGFSLEIPSGGIQMREVLKELILKTLTITNGNQVQAAKVLGITRSKLRYRMEQLAIAPQERTYRVLEEHT